MNQPIILLYNLENEKGYKIKSLSKRLGIEIKPVLSTEYKKPIGFLAGIEEIAEGNEECNESCFIDEMFIMVNFDDNLLNKFLKEYKTKHIEPVALKAILTPYNKEWDSIYLNKELKMENNSMNAKGK